MSSRVLILGDIVRALVRRTRRDDGRVFGVLIIRDTDRMETRTWTAFVNDLDLIEEIERLRVGEPIGISGPFSFRVGETSEAPEIEHRVGVRAIVDTRPRKPKTKTLAQREQAVKSDDAELAPTAPENAEVGFDDPLPW